MNKLYVRLYNLGRRWFVSIPNRPVSTPYELGKIWSRIAQGFVTTQKDAGAFQVRYGDLVIGGQRILPEISEYLKSEVPMFGLEERVGAIRKEKVTAFDRVLLRYELLWLQLAAKRTVRSLGYAVEGKV